MATYKALKLIVDLEVSAVTCPGVWLPNKGEVLVRLWLLGKKARTESVLPVFPLNFHETLTFDKVFDCQSLPEIHKLLACERVRAELQQLRCGCITPLAEFECSLLTLLFPEVDRPGLQCSEELSLCMQPLAHFPGILPPKLEISTRTVIQEELKGTRKKSCVHKTISSETDFCQQKRSCKDVRQLAKQAHSSRTPCPSHFPCSCRCTEKRPPFVVRHVDSDTLKPPPVPRSCSSSSFSSECECDSGCERGLLSSRPQRMSLCKCKCHDDEMRIDSFKDPTDDFAILDCKHHQEKGCTVCRLYKAYFGTNYELHRHPGNHQLHRNHIAAKTKNSCCRKRQEYSCGHNNCCGCNNPNPVTCSECADDELSDSPALSLSDWCRMKRKIQSSYPEVKVPNHFHSSYKE